MDVHTNAVISPAEGKFSIVWFKRLNFACRQISTTRKALKSNLKFIASGATNYFHTAYSV